MKRILIIKMWALGDILMATPMLAALRARWPDAHITWVVEASHAEILASHPGIDEVVPVDSGAWRRRLKKGNVAGWLSQAFSLRRAMRRRRFDAVINCQPDKWWSAVLCAAPVRIGLFESEHLPGSRRFYTHALIRPKNPPLHNTEHYLLATRALGCPDADRRMTIGETPDEAAFLSDFARKHGLIPEKPLVVLAPFSTGENRCWEPERSAALLDWLHGAYGAQVVLTLGPKEREQARALADATTAPLIVAGGTTIRQYIALLRRADLVVCVDSSAMHIAAAVDTPYVALFGPTPVGERAPLVGRGLPLAQPLYCAPCDLPTCANPIFRQCMKLLEVTDAQAAVASLLGAPQKKVTAG